MHRLWPGLLALLLLAGCRDGFDVSRLSWPLSAQCTVEVQGKGTKDVETDYLPHVITCENGAADLEALKAQAVAARTYMYYKIATSGSVKDGTGDQVYTCGTQPAQKHLDAVKATSGQVLVYTPSGKSPLVICAFFVAGGKPSASSCVWASGDPDPTSTEKYVTYNEGKSGSGVEQTSLGWKDPSNYYNRGCFSQNGSQCLAQKGRPYVEMLRFYYGDDIQVETATGSCVTPVDPDASTPDPDSGVKHDSKVTKKDGDGQQLDALPRGDGDPLPTGDVRPFLPPGETPRSSLAGGCSIGAGGDARTCGGPLALAILILVARRRRDAPRG